MKVLKTTNYSSFKIMKGNRKINRLHLKRLKSSMAEDYLISPILINQNHEIIDGQHRFQAAKELELPINYIICNGYGLKEVQRLNTTSRKWNADDYMEGYAELGIESYIKYKEFKERWKFGHNETMALLNGSQFSGGMSEAFTDGTMNISRAQYIRAEKIAKEIYQIEPYYLGFKRRSFIYALLKLREKPQFDFDFFLEKLSKQSTALVDCSNKDQYIELIEEIYNWRNRNKVSLKY